MQAKRLNWTYACIYVIFYKVNHPITQKYIFIREDNMSPWKIVSLLILVAGIILRVLLRRSRHPKTDHTVVNVKPDAGWQQYTTFKEGIKYEGMNPEKVIQYGKTRFAYDEAKILIQTSRLTQGVTLSCADIVSYKIFRDGEEIPGLIADPEYPEDSCFDLRILIQMRDQNPIVLPFIDAPAGYAYAYQCAAKAAGEIAAVLDGILRLHAVAASEISTQKSRMQPSDFAS